MFVPGVPQIAGGGPNFAMTVAPAASPDTQGTPKVLARPEVEALARREFCGTCGTHLTTRSPRVQGIVVV